MDQRRIDTHPPTREELALIEEADRIPIPYWLPNVEFGAEREMWRGAHRAMGITDVNGFFTRRNLVRVGRTAPRDRGRYGGSSS